MEYHWEHANWLDKQVINKRQTVPNSIKAAPIWIVIWTVEKSVSGCETENSFAEAIPKAYRRTKIRRLPNWHGMNKGPRRVRTASRPSEISSASSGLTYVSESESAVVATDSPTIGLLETTSKLKCNDLEHQNYNLLMPL
ncbi:unnamed protein product [Orchesella dallaii]|uniref:Uncharacterized protein n=1 Tax=Orchesella dallaii TaxID=48710 RepID=A0ABP1S459_9HEXA